MYAGYGLLIDSELTLPDLARDAAPGAPPDVVVRLGPVAPPTADAVRLPLGLWVDGERIGIDVPGVARYSCSGGSLITVQPAPGASDDALRLFLLGSALGCLLTQRGLLVLHGNAFVVDGGCAVVLGHSGAGKSTLAAEMHRRGHLVLSDDVVPVDAAGRAVPGWPRIKLWQDALDRLGLPSSGLDRVDDRFAKFHVPLDRSGSLLPVPVRWIYVLDRYDGPLRVVPVTGAAAFVSLHEHSYRNEVLVGDLRRTHLARSADLARTARLARVDRPHGVDSVAASADAILADIRSTTTPGAPSGRRAIREEQQHATRPTRAVGA
ncbi:hypothetical protein ACFFOS_06675 [Nocardioides kongjuensis]|uniref:HPr kinase/phosphorylase C-terminal domain-containing protein n=1 Tax=Nocardioides kongjuensis TaxID=349522 RepID=A0A852RQZ8_9ACTN|nr:hypothetical protein [Nocardioides kongjuensis]NYD33375.1 hypothetical protein [Nocardioides kongjuensis]